MAGVSILCFFLLGGRVIYICIHVTTFVNWRIGARLTRRTYPNHTDDFLD